jgi:DNA-binding MarR family transcriptional regulator
MDITEEIIFFLKKFQENNELLNSNIEVPLSFSQIHCIAAIGDIEDANVTKLSNELEVTTGAITKICKKLFNGGFVNKYQNAGNKKEVYYTLTETGQYVYEIHKKIHDKSREDKKSIIAQYNDYEKAIIVRFLNDINSMVSNTLIDVTKKL